MAVVTVYNRDGSVYGTLDTSQYVFNNNLIGLESCVLDTNLYPYVKINGTYYINDGLAFQSVDRTDNSAAMMLASGSYLNEGNNFLQNVTDFMKYSQTEEIERIKVFEGFYDAKQYSIPNYKINNVYVNGWGYPGHNDGPYDRFNFSSEEPFWPYKDGVVETERFRMQQNLKIKAPWLISHYFDSDDVVKADEISYKREGCWYKLGSDGKEYEIVLTENTKVLMYVREPATLNVDIDPLSVNLNMTVGDQRAGTATLSINSTTTVGPTNLDFKVAVDKQPNCYIYDLTDAIKQKKAFKIYSSAFNKLVQNGTIKKLSTTSENYSLFSALWRPVQYNFPTIDLSKGFEEKSTDGNGWILSASVDEKSLKFATSFPSTISTQTVLPNSKYKESIEVSSSQNASISLGIEELATPERIKGEVALYVNYYAEGLPVEDRPEWRIKPYFYPLIRSSYGTVEDYFSENKLIAEGDSYTQEGYVYRTSPKTITDIWFRCIHGVFCGKQTFQGSERRHYAVAIWDLDRKGSLGTTFFTTSVILFRVGHGTPQEFIVQTDIEAEDNDILSLNVIKWVGGWSLTPTIIEKTIVDGKWCVRFSLTPYGGGSYDQVEAWIEFNCERVLI